MKLNQSKNEVKCKNFSMWNMSISTFIGISPRVDAVCGNCGYYFHGRFNMDQFNYRKLPVIMCPKCSTLNQIPITTEDKYEK